MAKRISPEDKEILKVLEILEKTLGGLMAGMTELNAKIAELKTSVDDLKDKQDATFKEVDNAENRLLAKIAAGTDTQPAIDALAPIAQSVADMGSILDT